MKQFLFTLFAAFLLLSCVRQQQNFERIKKGMDKNQVIAFAGEPDKKNDFGIAEFWNYNAAKRTVVFRNDTVYNVITSSEARLDSIKLWMKHTEKDIKRNAKEMEKDIKRGAKKLESDVDSLRKK